MVVLLVHLWALFLYHSIRVLQLPIDYTYPSLHRYTVLPHAVSDDASMEAQHTGT